jgi:hypothetical protein
MADARPSAVGVEAPTFVIAILTLCAFHITIFALKSCRRKRWRPGFDEVGARFAGVFPSGAHR